MTDVYGYIRVILPRYARKGQQEAMDVHGITRILADEKDSEAQRASLVRMVRNGTVVAIRHLFLLARPKHGRSDLWKALDAIENRGGVVWELHSDRKTSAKPERDQMVRDAIEALARGRHKRSKWDKRGRPRRAFTVEEVEQAKAAWNNRKLKTWKEVEARLPVGFSCARAYRLWGARE
jgi:hypothetical protein